MQQLLLRLLGLLVLRLRGRFVTTSTVGWGVFDLRLHLHEDEIRYEIVDGHVDSETETNVLKKKNVASQTPSSNTNNALLVHHGATIHIVQKAQHIVVPIARLRRAPVLLHVPLDLLVAIANVLPDFRQLIVRNEMIERLVDLRPQVASDLGLVLRAEARIVDLRPFGDLVDQDFVDICTGTEREWV